MSIFRGITYNIFSTKKKNKKTPGPKEKKIKCYIYYVLPTTTMAKRYMKNIDDDIKKEEVSLISEIGRKKKLIKILLVYKRYINLDNILIYHFMVSEKNIPSSGKLNGTLYRYLHL